MRWKGFRGRRLRRAAAGDGSLAALERAAADAAAALRRHGFVNYFGLQRFGTGGSSNASVGDARCPGNPFNFAST